LEIYFNIKLVSIFDLSNKQKNRFMNTNNTNLYFSFVGNCKGYKVNEVENFGNMIHNVDMMNGRISIYESHHKDYVIVEEYHFEENQWCGHEYYDPNSEEPIIESYTYYMCKRNSFDCNPFVPVSTFGESLHTALF
jgi:hypothetical protein